MESGQMRCCNESDAATVEIGCSMGIIAGEGLMLLMLEKILQDTVLSIGGISENPGCLPKNRFPGF